MFAVARGETCGSIAVFFLNAACRIERAEIVEAERDEEALTAALIKRQSVYSAIEVWDGARKVFPQALDRREVDQLKRTLLRAGLVVVEEPPNLN